MFTPMVAKAKANAGSVKTSALQRSPLVEHQRSGAVEHAPMLRPTNGNQAVLRLFAQRARSHEQEVGSVSREPASDVAWDFTNIPVVIPDMTSQPQAQPPLIIHSLPRVRQPKLAIGAVSDPLEDEADAVAEQVMRMPEPSRHKSCPACSVGQPCPECEESQLQRKGPAGERRERSESPELAQGHRIGSGQPLDPAVRAFFEPRFGVSFGQVLVHADQHAAESARSENALAFTIGNHIVFGENQYAPHSDAGRRLFAHELVHTLQQTPRGPAQDGIVQRQTTTDQTVDHSTDARLGDPSFLVCLVLCYLGIPPGLWRTVVNDIIRAVSDEYRERYGETRGSQEFESWRAAFLTWSAFNVLKTVIVFLAERKIGLFTITSTRAILARRAILDRLLVLGLTEAGLGTAAQVIRKVAIAIEIAWAAGCAAYCAATTAANALVEFSTAALGAVSSFVTVLSQAGSALSQVITKPILVARMSMDPSNWDLSALPARSRRHLNAIGLAFRLAFTPDAFLSYMARTLDSYNIADLLSELAQDINSTLQSRGGFFATITFTPQFIGGLSPLQFINLLKDYGLLSFTQDPETLADQQLSAGTTAAPTP